MRMEVKDWGGQVLAAYMAGVDEDVLCLPTFIVDILRFWSMALRWLVCGDGGCKRLAGVWRVTRVLSKQFV